MKTEPLLLSKRIVSSALEGAAANTERTPGTSQAVLVGAIVDRVLDFLRATDAVVFEAAVATRTRMMEMTTILYTLKMDDDCMVASLLHPLVNALQRQPIAAHFSSAVVLLMEAMDGLSALPFEASAGVPQTPINILQNPARRVKDLCKLLLVATTDIRVLIIQMARVLQRLRRITELPSAKERFILTREAKDLYAPLANRLGIWQLKWELEDLVFKELQPESYHQIAKQLKERRVDRERYIASICKYLSEAIQKVGIQARISGRPKHIFGIYNKMRRKSLAFDHVFDACAVRILTDSENQCYAALGVVHSQWECIREEFDDYIAAPKPNGYRSLHTAVTGPEGKSVEVQIRTWEMHEFAEFGVASHWRYKENIDGHSEQDVEKRIQWIRRLLDRGDQFGDDAYLLEQLQAEFANDQIYVLTPKRDVLKLSARSTVLDFAYRIHTDVGHHCRGARVNGVMAPLTRVLKTGDMVEVVTARIVTPSRDWLNASLGYLHTARAKAKVRNWFKQQDRHQHLADGRTIWHAELRRVGVEVSDYSVLCARYNVHNLDEFLILLGRGEVSLGQLSTLLQSYRPQPEAPSLVPLKPPQRRKSRHRCEVSVSGMESLMTHRARCCKPLPGDRIIGYITHGRGVSIHHSDCHNITAAKGDKQRQRLIDVSWLMREANLYEVGIVLYCKDDRWLLRDISALITREHISILHTDSARNNRQGTAVVHLSLEVGDRDQVAQLLLQLKQLPNVYNVSRASG